LAYRAGDLDAARARHEEALAIRTELGERGTVAESQIALARLALAQDRSPEAEPLARTALGMFTEQKAVDNEAIARATLARAQARLGRRDQALTQARAAVKAVAGSQSYMARFEVLIAAAEVEAAAGTAASRTALANALSEIETRARANGLGWHQREAARATTALRQSRRSN
jgi:hypothetical protein